MSRCLGRSGRRLHHLSTHGQAPGARGLCRNVASPFLVEVLSIDDVAEVPEGPGSLLLVACPAIMITTGIDAATVTPIQVGAPRRKLGELQQGPGGPKPLSCAERGMANTSGHVFCAC